MSVRFKEFDVQDPEVANALKEIVFELTKLREKVDGDSIFSATIYRRSASAPATPTEDDGQYDFTNKILTPPTDWSIGVPAGTDPVYTSHGTFFISGVTGVDLTVTWSDPEILAQDGDTGTQGDTGDTGAAGVAGFNTATLTAYKRAASAPSDDPGASITYTFATADWTPGNGWAKTIPSGSNPLYALSATAFSQSETDDILSADWSAPTLILQDGEDGATGDTGSTGTAGDDGLNVATAYIYQRTATDSAPTLPSVTATYTFATGNIADLNNGWTDSIPSAGTDDFLWVSLATASNTAATDAIASGEWQAAQKLAEDGTDGTDGIPGLPGASFLTDYDNADADGSSSSQGRYHFLTSIANNSGTFSWSTITTLGGVNYFSLYKVGTTTDYSSYFPSVKVGDIKTWWITNRKWVAFRITSVVSAPTNMFKWGVSLIAFDEADDAGNISSADGVAVVLRFSRASSLMAADDVTFSSVSCNAGTGNTTQKFKVDSDGTVDASTVTSGVYTNQYTWLNVGTNVDYEVKMTKIDGLVLTSGTLDSWLVPSTDLEWIRTATAGKWIGQLLVRNVLTGAIIDSITVELDNITA